MKRTGLFWLTVLEVQVKIKRLPYFEPLARAMTMEGARETAHTRSHQDKHRQRESGPHPPEEVP